MNKKTEFKKLVEQHKDRVYSYASYMLHNWADAEETTQFVFLRLWENWERIERKKMKAWIMQVAHNHCIDQLRKRKLSAARVTLLEPQELSSLAQVHNHHGDPELVHERNERRAVLLSALNTLPERTKSMILLHYFQGLSYESIGELLDATLSSVKVTIHRGKKKLKTAMLEQCPEVVESL